MSANLVILAEPFKIWHLSVEALKWAVWTLCYMWPASAQIIIIIAFNFIVKPRRKLEMYLFQSAIARIVHVFLGSMYDILVEEAPLFIAI